MGKRHACSLNLFGEQLETNRKAFHFSGFYIKLHKMAVMRQTAVKTSKRKKRATTTMTTEHNNQSHGRNEDGGIRDERQVGKKQ